MLLAFILIVLAGLGWLCFGGGPMHGDYCPCQSCQGRSDRKPL